MNNYVINCLNQERLCGGQRKKPKKAAQGPPREETATSATMRKKTQAQRLTKRDAETDLRRQSACLASSVNGTEVATIEEFDGTDKPSPGAEPYIDRGASMRLLCVRVHRHGNAIAGRTPGATDNQIKHYLSGICADMRRAPRSSVKLAAQKRKARGAH
jgi:hypothetical protein